MKDIVNPQIWECNTQVIPKVGLSIWDFTCDSQNGNWLFFPVLVATVMSLIRTDYVPEWRISAHAQSVLAAGQKHHTWELFSRMKM